MRALLHSHGIHDIVYDPDVDQHSYVLYDLLGIVVLPSGLDEQTTIGRLDQVLAHWQAIQQRRHPPAAAGLPREKCPNARGGNAGYHPRPQDN